MKTPPLALLAGILLFVAPVLAQADEVSRSRINRVPVSSSNVASVGYSRHLRALEIEFVRGAVYRFVNVPPAVYRDLLASESKGRFIAEKIRGRYLFVRVQPRRPGPASTREIAAAKKD
ncbi:MAG: KTSC domain-containing protein [Chthoniobacterales bacterium]